MSIGIRWGVAVLLAAGLAGCGSDRATPAGSPPAIHLTATLSAPTTMTLAWTGAEPGAAGRVVEFATEADGQYAPLQFVPPRQMTYTHADLMPGTTFYYRVRSYFGPTSPPVDVTLPPGPVDENAPQADQPWARPRKVDRGPVATRPVRGATGDAGAPTDFMATPMPAGGIQFTWTDHASDEDGYLLEIRTAAGGDFSVAAVLDPDINSTGLLTLPNQRSATFRVRAFYYGPASNIAHQKTGGQP